MNWVVDTGAQLSFVPKSGFDKYGKKLEKLDPLCNSNRKLVGAGYNTLNCVSHVTVELGVENTGITEPVYIVDAATKLLLGLPLKIWINSQCAENLQYHRKGTSESWRCSSVYRLGQKFLDKYFGWRNFGEMFVFLCTKFIRYYEPTPYQSFAKYFGYSHLRSASVLSNRRETHNNKKPSLCCGIYHEPIGQQCSIISYVSRYCRYWVGMANCYVTV